MYKGLSGKRILLISPYFFNYQNEISKSLMDYGAIVDLYNERPSSSISTKILIKLNKKFIKRKINDYYQEILNKSNKYDALLIIKGELIPNWFIQELKVKNPDMKVILYLWDAIKYIPNYFEISNYVDYTYSFDFDDCKKYQLMHLSNFRSSQYENFNDSKIVYDFTFIGTINYDRAKIINEILKVTEGKYYFHLYFHKKWIYIIKCIFNKDIRELPREYIKFNPLKHEQILEVYSNSRIIIDIQAPGQGGLSMRPFETLKMKKKLITTNNKVKNYDFYNEQNILVIDRKKVSIPTSFINSKFKNIDDEIIEKYSLNNWTKKIMEGLTNENR